MDKMVFEIFWKEIERQCQFANFATTELRNGLAQKNQEMVWYALQNFLTAVGHLSKIFWPKIRYKKRGRELRRSLGVKHSSPLKPRKIRHLLQRFDEKMEKWASSPERSNFVDNHIGPPETVSGISPEDIFCNFDDTTWTLQMGSDKYEIRPMVEVVNELFRKVTVELRESGKNTP